MNNLAKKVLLTIDKFNMIKKGTVVIAAVSGGHDSLCMLNILNSLRALRGFELYAVHVNHSFRDEADEDEQFFHNTCNSLGIRAFSKKVDVLQYSKEHKISFETAGREVRYNYFDSLIAQIPNSVVATAHSANDSAESFFMHLIRGSGLSGLTGIKPIRGKIIRPMIELSRQEIEEFCVENNLNPRIDITNFEDNYKRNDIRHNVMPQILQRAGIDTLSRTIQILATEEEFLQEYTNSIVDKYILFNGNSAIIEVKSFNPLPLAIKRRLLRRALPKEQDVEIGLVHIDSIISIAEKNYGGKCTILPGGINVSLARCIITINGVQSNDK